MNATPMTTAEPSAKGRVSPRTKEPWKERERQPLRVAARLLRRLVRAIAFRARYWPPNAFNAVVNRAKRRLILPVRDALLGQKPLAVRAGGQTFLLSPEGYVAMDIWARSCFERHELEFVLGALQPGMTFIDVGANVGLFSIPAAKKVEHGRVFAFEPSAWTMELLSKNASLNQLRNLEIVHSAVGDYTGEATLQVNASGKDGLNTIGKPVHDDSEIVTTEKVPITTLDDFLRGHSILHVDVMKVDVEGAELLVFRGAKDLLAKHDAPLILYESGVLTKGFGYHPVETMWLLEQYGYAFFHIDSRDGRITRLSGMQPCDTMLIAAKPTHVFYPLLQGLAR